MVPQPATKCLVGGAINVPCCGQTLTVGRSKRHCPRDWDANYKFDPVRKTAKENNTMKFEAGDHVFIGRGPGGAVKHHAIVVSAEDNSGFMEIVEFGVFDKDGQKKVIAGTGLDSALAGKKFGEVRRSRVQKKSSEGTWQPAREPNNGNPTSRSPEEVTKAALFLLENGQKLLPKYHITMANGECFAQWCQTGEFSSGQADRLYGSVNKVQTVAKMLPVAAVVGGKKSSSKVTSSSGKNASGKASGAAATATATAAVAGIVTAATAMVEKRHAKVNEEWIKTKQILDAAYASHIGQSA